MCNHELIRHLVIEGITPTFKYDFDSYGKVYYYSFGEDVWRVETWSNDSVIGWADIVPYLGY